MLKHKLKYLVFTVLSICFLHLNGQEFSSAKSDALLLAPAYTFQFPIGDISKRFGANSSIGGGVYYKFKQNWIVGLESNFLFSTNVKENNILDSLLTNNNLLITNDGLLTEFGLFERGMNAYLKFGKVISFSASNPNSGLMLLGGAGFLQHKIFIDLSEEDFPQLDKNYQSGYDRLTSGFSISQFIGYAFIHPDKLVNFYAGLEFIEGFTQMRRNWLFDLNKADTESRFDMLIGLKIGWVIPKFTQSSEDEFYY